MKKSSIIMACIMTAIAFSCATNTAKTGTASTSQEGLHVLANKTTVKIQGRTFVKNDVLYLTQSASAVEFLATAKSLSVSLVGDTTARPTRGSNVPTNYARYAIYVNGTQTEVGTMDNAKKEVSIFSGKKEQTAEVRIVKLTESAQSIFGIKEFTIDGGTIEPLAEKSLKIEFIGDSITCGYGVEASGATESFTTQTENAEKAYAYLTAKALDADYSIVSYSGHGIYSGYTTGERNVQSLVPPLYTKVGFSYADGSLTKYEWNFADFVPNIVVINLGTNDASYCKTPVLRGEYIDAAIDFLKTVREKNPTAKIVCTLGIMGDELYPSLKTAVDTYTSQTGDTNVVSFHFEPQNPGADGIGADYHPSEKTQRDRAAALTAFLK